MKTLITPVLRQSLTDDLAQRVRALIQADGYRTGDRLPAIAEMARQFGVGHPTLREALKKLETVGLVTIRHGSGVYVGRETNTLLVSNPIYDGAVSKKLLTDLIEARMPVELCTVALAAEHGTDEHLAEMSRLLAHAEAHLGDDAVLTPTNMAFHRHIALASGNTVLVQVLEVLSSLFQQEQRLILDIYGSREQDHREHLHILAALRSRDVVQAVARMRAHLEGVREALIRWNPKKNPVTRQV